jgi:hypothetical protein
MRYFLEACTDSACIALFDPSGLPDDFERRWEDEPIESARALQQDGRMFFVETGADGFYSIALFVEQEIPQYLVPYLSDLIEVPRLRIPSGKLWFCGGEDAGPALRVGEINQASLAPGEYQANLWRGNYPDEMVEDLVRRKLGVARNGLETLVGTITGLGFVSSVFLVIAGLFSWFATWTCIALAITVPLTAVGLLVLNLPYFGRMAAERRNIEKNYPSIICELRLLKPSDR